MDEEIKGIDELEQALEEQITGEVEVDIPDLNDLQLASGSLNELVEIGDTIKAEGVSQEDVRSVFTIIKRLNEAGIEVGVGASLEEFEITHYTPGRSMVNQTISQEGIGETIVSVIKAVIEKLIEYSIKTVRFFKVMGAKDKTIEAAFERAKDKSKDVQKAIALFNQVNMADSSKVDEEAMKYAHTLLLQGGLPRNRVTVAALMYQPTVDVVKSIHAKTERSVMFLRQSVKSLRIFLTNPQADLNVDVTMMEDLALVRDQIGLLQEIDPAVYFLQTYVKPDYFVNNTLTKEAEPIARYEYILKGYYSVADELRGIRKYNLDAYDEQAVRFINEVIAELTQAFEDLGLIAGFFAELKNTQMQVLKLQLQYLNRHASLLYLNCRDNAVSDLTKKKVEGIFTDLEKKLKTYGL
ncbi:hypothetical protein D3C71_562910 [compost metagenome]